MTKTILVVTILLTAIFLQASDIAYQLYLKADSLRNSEKYVEAAQLYVDHMKEHGEEALFHYSAACLFSLAGNRSDAFTHLDKAIDMGILDKGLLESDTDLTQLHDSGQWGTLMSKVDHERQVRLQKLPEQHDRSESIDLPEPSTDSETSIEAAMANRRSRRKYQDSPLTLQEVSQVLWAAYGITKKVDHPNLRGGFKTAPSAGATYPLEIYLAAWRVQGLETGIYLYEPDGHKLIPVKMGDHHDGLADACWNQTWVRDAPASLVYSALYSRTTNVYGDRGRERYVPMDLGHSAQNVYLQVESLGMGTVAVGAFDDFALKILTGMTRVEEPLYMMPLGKVGE